MSSQDAIDDSGSLKSRSVAHSGIVNVFRFEHNGSLKDRLLTALIVLSVALALSLLAIYLPYGRLLCVAWASLIAMVSAFEVVRLFARHHETLHYRPIAGVVTYAILVIPALVATSEAAGVVLGHSLHWQRLYLAVIVSGQLLMIAHVLDGRFKLEDAARFSERYSGSFFLLAICAPQLIVVAGSELGVQLLWWIAGVAALNDAAAYFVGSSLGKHKMAPGLSPNKSIEGSVAGLVIGSIAGVALWRVMLGGCVSDLWIGAMSVAAVCSAQAGDLAKSYLKRLRGVKDTGAFFPGHGGVLDRFDAMIAAAPVVLLFVSMCGLL